MATRSVIPFGPQHPVLPEPIHLDLVVQDEQVVEAIPQIGFIHRGLEKLVEKRDFNQFVYVAERTCGICSVGHGWGYVSATEKLLGLEMPRRVEYLRTILEELSRVHSHLLWLGLLADASASSRSSTTAGACARPCSTSSSARAAAASSSRS